MGIAIKPSDLKYKYPKDTKNREQPKFSGKPDPMPFNRDDLYDIIPMFEAVMDELKSDEGPVLHLLEELLNRDMPRFVQSREEVFDYLVNCAREIMEEMR